MAFVHLSSAFLFLILATFTLANPYPPAEAPHHHHHHHHHQHHHHQHPPTWPPSYTPTPAPSHPPVKPPAPPHHPPTPPPSHPPPPRHPPTTPPSYPPVKPPPHHNHPPSPPPASPPAKPPAIPPSKPPTNPPRYPPVRKLVAVQGVVYCKPCKYGGVETVMGATPLNGAVVKLVCNNTKYGLVEQTKTDRNGYFLFLPQKLTTAAFHKCKVYLVSSPAPKCSIPTNFHGGVSGAVLIPGLTPPAKLTTYQYFNVGPFAFDPHKRRCHS